MSDFERLVEVQASLKKDQEVIKQGLESLKKIQEENTTMLREQHLQTDVALSRLWDKFSSSERRFSAEISEVKQVSSKTENIFAPVRP